MKVDSPTVQEPLPIDQILAREGFGDLQGEYIDSWSNAADLYALFELADANGGRAYAVVLQNSHTSVAYLAGWFESEVKARGYIQRRVKQ